jgi:hypothetical protein
MLNSKFFLFFFFFSPLFAFADHPTLYFAVDIDRTLVDHFQEGRDSTPPLEITYKRSAKNTQTHETVTARVSEKYRLVEGCIEFLQALSQIPNAKIAFVSTGIDARNLALLRKIRLPNPHGRSRSAFEIANGGIFSRESLENDHQDRSQAVPQPPSKDLSKIFGPGEHLKNAILIDDNLDYVVPGQEKNFLWLPNSLGIHQNQTYLLFHEPQSLNSSDSFEVVNTIDYDKIDHNRLIRAMGIIDVILQHTHDGQRSATEILTHIQWNIAPTPNLPELEQMTYQWNLLKNRYYLLRGYKWFKKVNPLYRMTWMTSVKDASSELEENLQANHFKLLKNLHQQNSLNLETSSDTLMTRSSSRPRVE